MARGHRIGMIGSTVLAILAALLTAGSLRATDPVYLSRILSSGFFWANITNYGTVGSLPAIGGPGAFVFEVPHPRDDMRDYDIHWVPSMEFPAGSKNNYLHSFGILFGGIVGADTLVSTTGTSFLPFLYEFASYGNLVELSSDPTSSGFSPHALAERQLNSVFADTTLWFPFTDGIDGRTHRALGLQIEQRSLTWTSSFASRFLILDFTIRHIGQSEITHPVIGFVLTPRVWNYDRATSLGSANIVGFSQAVPSGLPGVDDSLPLVWASENDGEPVVGKFDRASVTGALGLAPLRVPPGRLSFNWWASAGDATWGPEKIGSRLSNYGGSSSPIGDRALYHLMTNGEIDYDQVYAVQDFSADGWKRPSVNAEEMRNIADGTTAFAVLSYALDSSLHPGDSLSVTVALVTGSNYHKDPYNFSSNFYPPDPSRYLARLDFSDLHTNARWAHWVFDSPGIDTDGDGYRGEFHLSNCRGAGNTHCDTIWFRGDGIPDWGGPKAPPSPPFEITTSPHTITLRWNGAISETSPDHFSRRLDFEGYRVYSARVNTPGQYTLIASWDIPDNYRRFAYDDADGHWKQISYPLRTNEWRALLDDDAFNPRNHTHPSPLNSYKDIVTDTTWDAAGNIIRIVERTRMSYWAPEGPNQGNTYPDGRGLHPNPIQRIEIRDTVIDEKLLQYGVYEMTFDNLNAAIPLWMAVTAFDHGDYLRNTDPIEGIPNANAQFAFPVHSADVVSDSGLKVTVYPNPYKIAFNDAFGNLTNYYAQGYEGYGEPVMDERSRRIWFANLPDTATIRIFSLDGDLIREIHHPDPHLTSYSSIVGWDLVSRNTQAVVSGIYLYRVDSRLGSQIGKLVIIK